MAYKTILMHCNDRRAIRSLLAPAVYLAEKFQAHLTGLSVVPPVHVVAAGVPGGVPVVLDEHCKIYRKDNPAMRQAFEEALQGRGFVGQWLEEEAGAYSVADAVLRRSRAADLVVASQADPDWPNSDQLDIADRLAVESGRPVLIVPRTGAFAPLGTRVVVAWNATREAARAVFDAMPILQQAEFVKVVWVNPQSEDDGIDALPAIDICETLSRHGVRCEAMDEMKPRAGVGPTLLGCIADAKADLLVMGCYGHARLREFVFGGASRHVLENMTTPVLMSH